MQMHGSAASHGLVTFQGPDLGDFRDELFHAQLTQGDLLLVLDVASRLADRRDDRLGDPVLELTGCRVGPLGAEDDLVEATFGEDDCPLASDGLNRQVDGMPFQNSFVDDLMLRRVQKPLRIVAEVSGKEV